MRFLFFIALLALSGCAGTADIKYSKKGGPKLLPTDTAYISVPNDGRYGSKIYAGSGTAVTQITAGALSKYMSRVETGSDVESQKVALGKAKAMDLKYLIEPRIFEWEDRATEWSMKSDRVSVRLTVIKVETGETIASGVINGESSIMTIGGDHPQDLLPKPIDKYAASLFQR